MSAISINLCGHRDAMQDASSAQQSKVNTQRVSFSNAKSAKTRVACRKAAGDASTVHKAVVNATPTNLRRDATPGASSGPSQQRTLCFS